MWLRVSNNPSFFWGFAIFSLNLEIAFAFEQCYYPDGSVPTDYLWVPCNSSGSQFSSCCVPSEGDICQDNGLCYFANEGLDYRGTCTDRTWNDPACPNICVTGFDGTWTWTLECDASGSSSYACGPVSEESPSVFYHSVPTCDSGAVSNTAAFQTAPSTTSDGRYTPPPSLDTSIYSVYTSTYTTILAAYAQSTTLTSTFQSTFTSTIGRAAGATTGAVLSSTPASSHLSSGGHAAVSTGASIGIIVGVIVVAIAVSVGIFLFIRRTSAKKQEAIRLNSASYPPPNGPVGADQVYPYEVDVNEVSKPPQKYNYMSPKTGTHEMDNLAATAREEKKWAGARQMSAEEHDELRSPLRSPAPTYAEALMPVELDATPSLRNGR